MSETQLNYPFTFSRSSDKAYLTGIASTSDYKAIWKNRILLTLGTRPGERVMRPDFGSNLYSAVYENESTAAEIANDSINQAFSKWLSELSLKSIEPRFEVNTGVMTVTIIYGLPNAEEDSVTINTGIFNRAGELIQEIK
jgi:phage baseplate assembly protein W